MATLPSVVRPNSAIGTIATAPVAAGGPEVPSPVVRTARRRSVGVGHHRAAVASPLLSLIRAVHSAILLVMLTAIGWLVVSGIAGRRDRLVGVAAGLVAVESFVFVANDRVCPLTPLAERHGARRGSVSDIWLPDVAARTLPVWSGALVLLAAGLHVRAWARGRGDASGRVGAPATVRSRRCGGAPGQRAGSR